MDRAALKQARAEDMRYVKDPLFFDFFNIFTGNRAAIPCFLRSVRNTESNTALSDCTHMQEDGIPPARHCNSLSILPQVLSQELVL